MRIVSLLPSATEIVAALGLADHLVGVTHECDFPPDAVAGRVVLTSSQVGAADAEGNLPDAGEIDRRVREARERGESLYALDVDRLRELKPDLVITQGLCDVCAVSQGTVVPAVEAIGSDICVLSLNPTNLAGVLDSIRQVGEATRRAAEAETLARGIQERWDRVREKAAAAPERPKTLLLEWTDPPYSAGHWNPELLEIAGAVKAPWDLPGEPSRPLDWQQIVDFAPEMLVLIPCGFDANRAIDEAQALTENPGWYDLPAVRASECFAADGHAFFNRPGPRLAESAEILATILHPETFLEMLPPYSVRIFEPDLLKRPEE